MTCWRHSASGREPVMPSEHADAMKFVGNPQCQKPFLDEVLIRRTVHGHGTSVRSCRRGMNYEVYNALLPVSVAAAN